jgi:hypothetical protein
MNKQRGIASIIYIIIIIALLAVGGIFAYQYFAIKNKPAVQTQQNQITNQSASSSSSSSSQSQQATASWKRYTNSQYGFSISYNPSFDAEISPSNPGEWTLLIQHHNTENLAAVPGSWYSITIKDGISSLNALKQAYPGGIEGDNKVTVTPITFAGYQALDMRFIAIPAYDHYVHAVGVVKDNKAYIISYWNDKETSQDEFNQMLFTFKFTK